MEGLSLSTYFLFLTFFFEKKKISKEKTMSSINADIGQAIKNFASLP